MFRFGVWNTSKDYVRKSSDDVGAGDMGCRLHFFLTSDPANISMALSIPECFVVDLHSCPSVSLLGSLTARLKSRLAAGDGVKSLERIFKQQTPTAFFEILSLAIFLVRDDDPTF